MPGRRRRLRHREERYNGIIPEELAEEGEDNNYKYKGDDGDEGLH